MKSYNEKIEKMFRSKLFLVVTMILGVIILLYPLISDRYYRVIHDDVNKAYESKVSNINNSELENIIYKSRKYNEELAQKGEGIYDTSYLNFIRESLQDGKIPDFFKSGSPIARVKIPKIDVDLPVYFGAEEEILDKGSGMMYNTSLPIGGKNTHSVITAHRGMPQSRYFRDLGEIKKGDIFIVSFLGKERAYKVDDIDIIRPNDPSKLKIYKDKDYVTLLTCHPYMINSKRLIVRVHNIPYNSVTKKEVEKEKLSYRLRLFFVKYREYFYGVIIFFIVFMLLVKREQKIRNKRRKRRNIRNAQRIKSRSNKK